MKIIVSDRAADDLDTTFDYLSVRSRNAARGFMAQIDQAFADLALFPMIGRDRSDLAPSLRSQLAGAHVLFYYIDANNIIIVRILDGRMNIDREMRK